MTSSTLLRNVTASADPARRRCAPGCGVVRRGVVGGATVSKTFLVLRVWTAALAMLLVGLTAPARAQQFNGTLRGSVVDSTGAVLPGAQVSVVETGTNDTRALQTDARGAWVLPNLKPGTYRVTVTLDGFKTAALDNVKLDVQGMRELEIK